ncbi:MAG: hypothetical protein K9H64_06035 [Bacteroidales bacterium]|nr:hypothetical protein [Bacteroidales bacterium]MCF8455464.1 hypothetical protein [Bacteroidales bacterium]
MKNLKYKTGLLLLVFAFAGQFVRAQQITVEAKLDTNLIMIGDQIKFHLSVDQDRGFMVDFPLFPDTIVKDVEIIERSQVDTTFLSDKLMRLSQEYTITSFDSGFHVIPAIPFPFRGNNISDTIESRPVVLMVYTFQIDSVQGIADIKPPIDAPFTFAEAVPYIEIGLGIVAILVLIFWLIKRFGKKETQTFRREIPKEPAHVIALRELDALEKKKLWQQSKFKEYHSELTEIIRVYIEYRYSIMAMEQTSPEIIQQFERNGMLSPEQFEHLKQMLTLADYVKFAKLVPLPDENELSLKHAYDFVLKTKMKVDLTSSKESADGSSQPAGGSTQSSVNSPQPAESNSREVMDDMRDESGSNFKSDF